MESEDYAFYQGLVFLLDHNVEDIGYELTFSTEVSFVFVYFAASAILCAHLLTVIFKAFDAL